MRKLLTRLAAFLLLGTILSCGEGKVVISNESYEPRIVIEGYLFPGQPVKQIHISRNFPLDASLRSDRLTLVESAEVKIIDESDGREYPLTLHPESRFSGVRFDYAGDDWLVDYGKTYTIDVRAAIDGRDLHAHSTTTVPQRGFEIASVNYERLSYRPHDENGDLITFEITIERSPGTTFYVRTVRPLQPSSKNFIYDNPFDSYEPEEVEKDINDFNYFWDWIQNTPSTAGQSTLNIFWFNLWFYDTHEVIVYAADQNFIDFLRTYDDVQEEDGNFHEPAFNIEGDGIGVFGAAIADTVRIRVVPE